MLALVGLALAQDVRAWQALHEGMLMEAGEGEVQRAVSWYEGLIEGLPEDDNSQPELHYWLARARYALGEAEGARRALRVAADDPAFEDRAEALLGQIDSLDLQVRQLPVHHDFETGTSHWLHSWQHAGRGAIATDLSPGEDGHALAWQTVVNDRLDDRILLTFSPEASRVRSIAFDLRSEAFPAHLHPLIEDAEGQLYSLAEPLLVPTDDWLTVELSPNDFRRLEGSGRGTARPPEVSVLLFADVTAWASSDRGPNTLYLDDVSVR